MTEIDSVIEQAGRWIPDWLVSLLLLVGAVALAIFVARLLFRLLGRLVEGKGLFRRTLVARTRGPARLALIVVAVAGASAVAPLDESTALVIQQVLLVCFIGLIGWLASTAVHIWTVVYLRRFTLDAADNLLARKHVTQTRILRRTANTAILIATIAAALMTFEGVRQYGVSLLASAGAAGLVLGLALQPLLKNLIAGVQLAITQPIRIDDALLVEGEWGRVEEITSTYVVVRIWDLRRLILPLNYFIEQPFQNWTRESAELIGTVYLYADYRLPVAALREKLSEVVSQSPLWDRKVVGLQVTDFRETTMEIRMLVGARNAGDAFDLRCAVREQMIGWLQQAHPDSLPRRRAELVARLDPAEGDAERRTPRPQPALAGGAREGVAAARKSG